ncbi:MAG TPA: hypothetical protein VM889_06035 [Candidatus Thermoplasmatota archaeon]|nr:hypothetical protein [Candidatus Thermoplasmatota archaeon]
MAVATVLAGFAGFVFAGTALGAEWFEYEGRATAGAGYLVPVPPGAEALEVFLTPTGDAAAARFSVLDPTDARVGYYELSNAVSAANIVEPVAGAYIVYVYDVKEGSLSFRLRSEEAPGTLKLQKAFVHRQDHRIATADEGGAFSKILTVNLKAQPVFMTILYEGAVENLVAEAVTASGPAVTIRGESGTSHGPGLVMGASGERTINPANLAAGAVDVTASADRFDGILYLTTLSVKRVVIEPVATPIEVKPDVVVLEGVTIARGTAVAIDVPEGVSTLTLSRPLEEGQGSGKHGQAYPWGPSGYKHRFNGASFVVYGPLDEFIAAGDLAEKDAVAEIAVERSGEYVVYVAEHATDVLATLDGGAMPILAWRNLSLVESVNRTARLQSPLGVHEKYDFKMPTPPLAIRMTLTNPGTTTGLSARFASEAGEAAWQDSGFQVWGEDGYSHTRVNPEAMIAGAWTLTIDGLVALGEVSIHSLTYDRAILEEVADDVDDAGHEH